MVFICVPGVPSTVHRRTENYPVDRNSMVLSPELSDVGIGLSLAERGGNFYIDVDLKGLGTFIGGYAHEPFPTREAAEQELELVEYFVKRGEGYQLEIDPLGIARLRLLVERK